jgi:RNA polymerase sigma-70 factor, ECF subfamily
VTLAEQQPLTDSEVVERVRGGERVLYELLMRRYNQRLYRVARSVVRDDAEAEDVLQDTWVKAYEHLDQFEGRSSFATWVTRIAFYEALARSRKSKRWTPVEDESGEILAAVERESQVETPEAEAMRGELGEILESAVDALPEGYRAVFVLRAVEQLSTVDTAESLGLTEEAVKTRLHRARALLRRGVEERMGPALVGAYTFMGLRCDRTVARVMQRIGSATAGQRLQRV